MLAIAKHTTKYTMAQPHNPLTISIKGMTITLAKNIKYTIANKVVKSFAKIVDAFPI